MGRKSKGLRLPNLVELQEHEIPQWMRDMAPPPGETVVELLKEAIGQPSLVHEGPYVAFFSSIVSQGAVVARQTRTATDRARVAAETLHAVPALAEALDRAHCAWIREALFDLFRWRQYQVLKELPRTKGRPKVVGYQAAVVDQLANAQLRELAPEARTTRTIGKIHQDAVRLAATVLGVAPASLANSVAIAKQQDAEREAKVVETWERLAKAAGGRRRRGTATRGPRKKARARGKAKSR